MEIVITLTPDGQITVSGFNEDKVTCLGMLEVAKQVIYDYVPSIIKKPGLMDSK